MPSAPAPVAKDLVLCCSPLNGGIVDDEAAVRLAAVFKALADPARVKLISLIAGSDNGEACVCDLIGPLGLSQPTVSHHMKLLVDAGLVSREQRGKWAYYRIVADAFDAVATTLAGKAR